MTKAAVFTQGDISKLPKGAKAEFLEGFEHVTGGLQ